MKSALLLLFLVVRSLSYEVPYPRKTQTFQSRTLIKQDSNLAIDGSRQTCSIAAGVNKTEHAWWRVIIRSSFHVYKILIFFKTLEAITPAYKTYLSAYVSDNETYTEADLCTKYDGIERANTEENAVTLLCNEPILGKYITIKKYGKVFYNLMLCEVKVFASGLSIVSRNKFAVQSTWYGYHDHSSAYAVDGRNNTCTIVYAIDNGEAWFNIQFDDRFYIYRIIIDFNQNTTVTEDQISLKVYVSDGNVDYNQFLCVDVGDNKTNYLETYIDRLCVKPNPIGKQLTISKYGGRSPGVMSLCEVTVIANLTTDEKSVVSSNSSCKSEEVACRIFSDFFCIPEKKVCDKIRDCPTGLDEINCTCDSAYFECLDGYCIPKDWVCDSVKDCLFGEDEENCDIKCEVFTDFICTKKKQCIAKKKRCDGYDDCDDFTDEQDCFEMVEHGSMQKHYLLMATFQGDSDYYVCASKWTKEMAFLMCYHLTGKWLGDFVEHKAKWINEEMVIEVDETDIFVNTIPSLRKFKLNHNCSALVEILCNWEDPKDKYECGTRTLRSEEFGQYLVNGNAARPGAWPWNVQILARGHHVCGGSIINNRWILTAAHCSQNAEQYDLTVKVGTIKFNDKDAENIEVSHIVNHPSYSFERLENDIGLLRLSQPLEFSGTVSPICLPTYILSEHHLNYLRYCVMVGFGSIRKERKSPLYLMQGRMNLMNDSTCAKNLASIANDTEVNYKRKLRHRHLVCAGSVPTKDGINTCWGDGGSPLVCKDNHGVFVQVGMADLFETGVKGEECINSLLIKVDRYLTFINKVLESEDKFNKMARLLQTIIKIIPFLVISHSILSL